MAVPESYVARKELSGWLEKGEESPMFHNRRLTLPQKDNKIFLPDIIAPKITDSGEFHFRSFEMPQEAKVGTIRQNMREYLYKYEGRNGGMVLYDKLVEYDVNIVNGLSGSAILDIMDQFSADHPRHEGGTPPIRWVTNSNESSGGHIAEGIGHKGMYDDKIVPGVCVVNGVTNVATPLQDALCDGIPLVIFGGSTATTHGPEDSERTSAIEIIRTCTKWCYQIQSAAELPVVLDYAFYIACHGRPGSVYIDMPKDLQGQKVSKELIEKFIEEQMLFSDQKRSLDLKGHESHLARLKSYHHSENNSFEVVLHIGATYKNSSDVHVTYDGHENGIPFFCRAGASRLEAVPIELASLFGGSSNLFRCDHLPSNLIYRDVALGDFGEPFQGSKNMDEMMSLIVSARQPVIIAGRGCNDSVKELKALAEYLNIPVTTTVHGRGCFDERHPLALRMYGSQGHATANYMVQQSDLLISVGSRFDDRCVGNFKLFAPEARRAHREGKGGIIHVDFRLSQRSMVVTPTYFVHSTGKKFLQEAYDYLEGSDIQIASKEDWLARMKVWQAKHPIAIPRYPTVEVEGKNKTAMSVQYVIKTLDDIIQKESMQDEVVIATGCGCHQMVVAQLITSTFPGRIHTSGSLAPMGVCLGYLVGAKLANPDKICIGIDGDGSFNMTFTELKTIGQERIPVKILIVDNEAMGMVEFTQKTSAGGRYFACQNKNPMYSELAEVFGIRGLFCDTEEELDGTLEEFLHSDPNEPILLHCRIKNTPCFPVVQVGKALDDMTFHKDNFFFD